MKVTLIRSADSDIDVVNAARVSFDKKSALGPDGKLTLADVRLISYLAQNNHIIPFAHPQVRLHLRVPTFVLRQIDRHTVGCVKSEISRRYVDTPPEFYVADYWRPRAEDRKQGSTDEAHPQTEVYSEVAEHIYSSCLTYYCQAIDDGVCPEQARMLLPQAMYTEVIITGSLLYWARVHNLRSSEHAQKEIREVARQLDKIMTPLFPVCWKFLKEYNIGG
jgi:thymidylate synthase (FAD)